MAWAQIAPPPVAETNGAAQQAKNEQLHALVARRAPEQPLMATRVLWSYLHGAVSLRRAWPTRDGLDPEEAFAAVPADPAAAAPSAS